MPEMGAARGRAASRLVTVDPPHLPRFMRPMTENGAAYAVAAFEASRSALGAVVIEGGDAGAPGAQWVRQNMAT